MFALYLDLVAAYDSILREWLIGLPQGFADDPVRHLTTLALPHDIAVELANKLEVHGAFLDALDVDQKVSRLVTSLHTGTWMRYGNLTTSILTVKGSRQGCRLGGIIFNFIYSRVLFRIRHRLKAAGVIVKVQHTCAKTFLETSGLSDVVTDQDVVDATFVDH